MLNDDTGALHVDPRLLAHTAGQVLDTALELSTQALGLVVPIPTFCAFNNRLPVLSNITNTIFFILKPFYFSSKLKN